MARQDRGAGRRVKNWQFPVAARAVLRHKKPVLAKVCSAAVNGIDAYPVEVEVNAGWGDTLVINKELI